MNFSKISKILNDWWLEKAIFFETRRLLNKEKEIFLLQDGDFKIEVCKIRNEFNIPELDPEDDIRVIVHCVGHDTYEASHSDFVTKLNKKQQDKFFNKVKYLRQLYSLPNNFDEWIRDVVLYGKPQNVNIKFNLELYDYIHLFPKEVESMGLTTKEKQHLKKEFRERRGLKNGRIPKIYSKDYKYLCELLAISKNIRRRSKSDFIYLNKVIKRKIINTYNEIIFNDNCDPDNFEFGEDVFVKKKSQLIRKRIERYNKRNKKVKK